MAITFSVKVDVNGVKAVERAFEGIKEGVRNRVLKASIGKVARRAARVAKQRAPRGPSGTLKKSIGAIYRSYRKGEVWLYVLGPRRGITGTAPHQPQRRYPNFVPTRYGHLAERGRGALRAKNYPRMLFYPSPKAQHRIARVKVGPARGFRFMEKTYKLLDSPSARLTRFLIEDILAGIEREAAKYAAKGKSVMVSS